MLSPQSADPEAEQHDQAEGLSRKAGLPAVDTAPERAQTLACLSQKPVA